MLAAVASLGFLQPTIVRVAPAMRVNHLVAPLLHVSLPAAPGWRAEQPRMSGGFGLSEREMKRLSQMKRSDEPLEEEVKGLYVLGAVAGIALGPLLFGSVLLGFFLGIQATPMLAYLSGATGDKARETGWESWRLWLIWCRRAEQGWATVEREAEARGVTRRLRQARTRIVQWDERTGTSRKAAALAVAFWAILRQQWARLAASSLARRVRQMWDKTGIPWHWKEFKQRAILQARMAELRRRESPP